MAAGAVQSLNKFGVPTAFQPLLLSSSACQEMVFQDLSEEEEMEEEEEEEEEERDAMEAAGTPSGYTPHNEFVDSGLNDTGLTLQLLQFAERISDDIQRYFGQKGKEADSTFCNIYEDYCSPQLSGRVLYYADLVRISQSGEFEEDDGFPDPLVLPTQLDQKLWRSFCSKEEAEKLGPLAELFEYGLCKYIKQHAFSDNRKLRLERKYGHIVPMHGRKFPQSFWKEPSLTSICALTGNPPDFSDLLANWTSETS